MAKFTSLIPGVEIENIADDFKNAQKIEQYRLGKQARGGHAPQRDRRPLRHGHRAQARRRVQDRGRLVPV